MIKTIEALDLKILSHQKMIEINRNFGDKARIHDIELLIKKRHADKEFKVSELRNIPPCLDTNCPEHTILKPPVLESQLSNTKSKKQSQKRKTDKEDLEGFAFPKKTARPISPTKVLEPLQTQNNFETLTQVPEPVINLTKGKDIPKPRAPNPITLKGKSEFVTVTQNPKGKRSSEELDTLVIHPMIL
ncbi:hypothetical protein TNCV_3620331 [Trichonephila clavipes]|nr:hypothetical protein TNCV_3620331 [Trichonephila clavipes]